MRRVMGTCQPLVTWHPLAIAPFGDVVANGDTAAVGDILPFGSDALL